MQTSELNTISASRFVVASLALALLFLIMIGGINISLNLFGLYGDPKGLKLPVYSGNDRLAKYLLCRRYVPANFECLLVGNSVPRIFPVTNHAVAGQRVYNASLGGGTIGEYIQMVELCSMALDSKIRTVIMFVDPPSTQSSVARELVTPEQLDLISLWSTFSMRLWVEYGLCLSGRTQPWYDEFGVMVPEYRGTNWEHDFQLLAEDMASQHSGYPLSGEDKERLRTLSEICKRNNLKLICLATPIPAVRYKRLKPSLHSFYNEVSACVGMELLNPNESSEPRLRNILQNRAAFRDGRHLFPAEGAGIWESCWNLMIEPRVVTR